MSITITEEVQKRAIADLIPHPRNSKKHSDAQIDQIIESIKQWGWTNPVVIDESNTILAGHGRVMAAKKMGLKVAPVIVTTGWSDEKKRAYIIADNKIAENSRWDHGALKLELSELGGLDSFNFDLLGFNPREQKRLFPALAENDTPETIPDAVQVAITRPGDVWQCGDHRVMCGDSTDANQVAALLQDARVELLHADPPYGMGKESDGVMNDNLRREKLDAFQMRWWQAARAFLVDHASIYIWGNAPDLWRLWYRGGLADAEPMHILGELVWDKNSVPGRGSDVINAYMTGTERCLFIGLGKRLDFDRVNSCDFPDSWQPLLDYFKSQADACGIKPKDIKRLCGCGMYSHWFTESQYTLIPRRHYETLSSAYPGHFSREWDDLKAEWDQVKQVGRILNKQGAQVRFFDNTHDSMHDVWRFNMVVGEERFNHATPKPVAMMERIMRSSLPENGLCFEPFGGSGSTLMGAEKTGRRCYTMELSPQYVDTIVRRWQNHTGAAAKCATTGKPFDEIKTA